MREIRLNLKPLGKVLDILGSPHLKIPVISVAGTNGKGSVCAFMESILKAAGITPGLYTSPHLIHIRERIRIGSEIPPEEYNRLAGKISLAEDQAGEKLTEFEKVTSLAILYFFEKGCPLSIMETGMGGRFDASNICERKIASIITSVDIDHSSFLGNTREDIAKEKGGIIKKNVPVIDGSFTRSIKKKALQLSAPRFEPGRDFNILDIKKEEDGFYSFTYVSNKIRLKKLRPSLRGSHQCFNAALASAAAEAVNINISAAQIRKGINSAFLPGRLEYLNIGEEKKLILDCAHNPAACRRLADFFKQQKERGLYTVMAVFKDKDYAPMIRSVEEVSKKIFTFTLPSDRGLAGDILAREGGEKVENRGSLSEAFSAALNASLPGESILACGSFKTVSGVMEIVKNKHEK